MNLLTRIKSGAGSKIDGERLSLEEYSTMLNSFGFNGIGYGLNYGSNYGMTDGQGIIQTLAGQMTEMAPNNFVGLAQNAYAANGIVFACMLVRMAVFSTIRFQWQRMRDGKPGELFGTAALRSLETPWANGTTQDMLMRFIQDADLAGNSYWTRDGNDLVRLRPDWMDIVTEPRKLPAGRGQIGWKLAGYVYQAQRGSAQAGDPVGLLPDEVVHFCPIPDPLANFRGMSWLTPVLREIQGDQAMNRHKSKFFDNGATPNMVVKHADGATPEKIQAFAEMMKDKFGGVDNAYKTLHMYPGADTTVVGANMRQIDFKTVQGAGETRIAAAAGVPPIIVGLSEGLEAATYSNYGQARRRFADGTAHPLWQNLAGCLQSVLPSPGTDTRLWYDTHDVPFLREDEGDAADIAKTRAETISTYITAGYKPESVVKAVDAGDLSLLKHTGLVSVQLMKPGEVGQGQTPAPAQTQPETPSKGETNGAVNANK